MRCKISNVPYRWFAPNGARPLACSDTAFYKFICLQFLNNFAGHEWFRIRPDCSKLGALRIMNTFISLPLTHWGRVTHICVGILTIIGSDNGLSTGRRQAIIWTNAGILLIEPLGTNFSEILIGIQIFSFTKMRLKMPSAKWRPFCLDLNVLTAVIQLNRTAAVPGVVAVRCILMVVQCPWRMYHTLHTGEYWGHWFVNLGLYSLRRRCLISIGIPIINLRRSSDRLRFITGIPISVRRRPISE